MSPLYDVLPRPSLADEYSVPDDQIEAIAPAFRHIDDVSTAALRKRLP